MIEGSGSGAGSRSLWPKNMWIRNTGSHGSIAREGWLEVEPPILYEQYKISEKPAFKRKAGFPHIRPTQKSVYEQIN